MKSHTTHLLQVLYKLINVQVIKLELVSVLAAMMVNVPDNCVVTTDLISGI